MLANAEVPLAVRNVMCKKKKHNFRKRMNHLRVEGDKLLHKPELTDITGCTVEDIMNCPLSKYVHLLQMIWDTLALVWNLLQI